MPSVVAAAAATATVASEIKCIHFFIAVDSPNDTQMK